MGRVNVYSSGVGGAWRCFECENGRGMRVSVA